MDAYVKFADSTFNGGRVIRLATSWSHFTHLRAVFHCNLQSTGSHLPRYIREMYVADEPS